MGRQALKNSLRTDYKRLGLENEQSLVLFKKQEMNKAEKANRDAIIIMLETLKTEGFIPPKCFRIHLNEYTDITREYDVRLVLWEGVTVCVSLLNASIEVTITEPAVICYLVDEETRPKMKHPTVDKTRHMILELHLSDTVRVGGTMKAGSDTTVLALRDGVYQVIVVFNGDTALPRLKLLLERLCLGK